MRAPAEVSAACYSFLDGKKKLVWIFKLTGACITYQDSGHRKLNPFRESQLNIMAALFSPTKMPVGGIYFPFWQQRKVPHLANYYFIFCPYSPPHLDGEDCGRRKLLASDNLSTLSTNSKIYSKKVNFT
jgi:hypothetical protein